jgi:hypothetical protein
MLPLFNFREKLTAFCQQFFWYEELLFHTQIVGDNGLGAARFGWFGDRG